jgi:hypothetical protein
MVAADFSWPFTHGIFLRSPDKGKIKMSSFFYAFLVLLLAVPGVAQAAAVGKFTQVAGEVDLLKQGKLPAVPVKLEDGVEPGDVVRTKSQARAQITFMDDTTLTISPGSRVAVESYMYDADKKQRHGVVQVFYGMVETVVNKILQAEKPDILLKTHTAIMGVRGTKWYAVLHPIATDVYNEAGKVCVSNSFAEVTGEVCLKAMEFTRVAFNMPPTVPAPATKQDFLLLQKQLATGAKGEASRRGLPGGVGGLLPPITQLQTPGIVNPDIGKPVPPQSILPVIAVTPKVTPAPQPAPQPVFPPR